MAVIRARQPAITRLFPHEGNASYLVPNRRSLAPFINDPDVTMAFKFTEGTLNPVPPLAGPALTFTNAAVAKYVDQLGILQTAAINTPRFDHNPSNGTPLGLIIEPQAFNLALQSETFETLWTTSNAGVNANVAIAPDGNMTADRLVDNISGGSSACRLSQTITFATSTPYTMSCFMKADQLAFAALNVAGMAAQQLFQFYDLTNGTLGDSNANVIDPFIEKYPNGWFRCGYSFLSDAVDVSAGMRIHVAISDSNVTVPLDGTSSIFIWGAQVETGEVASSYITTVATNPARQRDICSTADVSWMTTGVGTLYVKAILSGDGPQQEAVSITGPGAGDRISLLSTTAQNAQAFIASGGATQYSDQITGIWSNSQPHKQAVAWALNDFQHYADGNAGVPDTLGAQPTVDRMQIGHLVGGGATWNGHIQELAYANVRKSNSELDRITRP